MPESPKSAGTSDGGLPLEEKVRRLFLRNLHAIKLGLDATQALLENMGRPQDHFLAVHVAGTNGKGSVSAMLAAILRACGLRTGLYTSPHLRRFNERVQVNGEQIPDAALADLIEFVDLKALAATAASGRDVTFFEFTTALAFEHFRREGVQVAVIETGMGGRLDATNVVDPLVSVITSIGFDHMAYLGETIEQIAGEKAGIIKPGRPVVVGNLPPEALAVVRRQAAAQGADLVLASEAAEVRRKQQTLGGQRIKIETSDTPYGPLTLSMLGSHQLANAGLAVATAELLRDRYNLPITRPGVEQGLAEVRWPARFQLLSMEPPTVLDGAHNPQAARVLSQTLGETMEGRGIALVTGFLADKDAVGVLRELSSRTRRCWAVKVSGARAMPLDAVMLACRTAGMDPVPASLDLALRSASEWALQHNGAVCIAGSLYLAADVLTALRINV